MLLKRILIFLSLITILLLSVQMTLAQEPDYDRVNQIAKNMNCPTCVGVNLADCRTQTCEQWRGQIQDLIAQGYTDQEVLDYFADQYGTQVLLEPPKEGSTLLLWVLPVAALLIGGGWVIYILRRWKKQPAPAAPVGPAAALPADDYLKQVEKDLEAH
jgi:cytochrome c-type biogenesis protein CcmH